MLDEVLSRVDLITAVEGSRRISRENLEFLFEKYELSPEDREQVLQSCRDRSITIFDESSLPSPESRSMSAETPLPEKNGTKSGKKGFFARLFGK